MDFSDRVRQRLEELGKNAAAVSREVGLSPTFVRDILQRRKRSVRGENLSRLAQALETTPEWLLGSYPQNSKVSQEPPATIRLAPVSASIVQLEVKGELKVGLYMAQEIARRHLEAKAIALVQPDGFSVEDLEVWAVGDRHASTEFSPGTLLICARASAAQLQPDDLVVISRRAGGDAIFERTVQRLNWSAAQGWTLSSLASDPADAPKPGVIELIELVVISSQKTRQRSATPPPPPVNG